MPGFTYKSYSFVDKDPLIDSLRTVIQDSGQTLTWISEHSGVNIKTVSKWLYGETKCPKAATVNAVLRVLGYKLEIAIVSAKPIIKPTPFKVPPPPQHHHRHTASIHHLPKARKRS